MFHFYRASVINIPPTHLNLSRPQRVVYVSRTQMSRTHGVISICNELNESSQYHELNESSKHHQLNEWSICHERKCHELNPYGDAWMRCGNTSEPSICHELSESSQYHKQQGVVEISLSIYMSRTQSHLYVTNSASRLNTTNTRSRRNITNSTSHLHVTNANDCHHHARRRSDLKYLDLQIGWFSRPLFWVTGTPIYFRENWDFGDSHEFFFRTLWGLPWKFVEILTVVINLSSISSVCGDDSSSWYLDDSLSSWRMSICHERKWVSF